MKKSIVLLLVVALCVLVFVGCNANTAEIEEDISDASDETVEITEEDKYGGDITVAFQSAPENFDPDHPSSDWTVTAVTNHVYEGLFEFNDDNKAIPHLAESYDVSEDGKTYKIKLREGVKFSDGDEMKSDDVKASLERWIKVNPIGDQVKDY